MSCGGSILQSVVAFDVSLPLKNRQLTLGRVERPFACGLGLIAERMHLKAIMIKERLLGPNDFEVALSVGHLASLYNYHMNLFEKAEALYLRSIQISLSLFGPSYSGLEYDYRGLQRVYRKLNNWERLAHYEALFDDWVRRRLEQRLQEGQFQKSNDYDEVMEVELCTTTSDEELERRKQVLAEFRNEFDATLGVSSVTTSSTSPSAPTSRGSAGGRTASPMLEGETSRSTGL
ncbi:unnamed protein product [Mesocestoides corti]|uniref:Uncharacterized protein n=2 Tax=Mesocestoides corti TaxID=53468 RepID=A0A0R3U762_MESCO|nr:unnamed protein product [Mesocestoides corti]